MCILKFRLTTKIFKRSIIDTLRGDKMELCFKYSDKVENKEEILIVQETRKVKLL